MDIILETKDLTKTYKAGGNHINAVDHTSICVERGDFVTIVGKSGSGKSTLLHLIGGLDYPTSGEVWIDNECITNMNEEDLSAFRRRKIGFIFQAFNLVPSLNVWENIILPIGLDDRKPDMVYLKEIIELLGLSEKLNNLPNTLSGGQQQRVAIARALATKPAIVLADEPTGNLDSKTSDEVMALLKTSAMKYEQTLIVITHNEDGNLQHLLCFCHFQYTRDGETKGSWCYQKTYSPLAIYRKPCTVFRRNSLWNLTWIPRNRILVQNGYSFRFYLWGYILALAGCYLCYRGCFAYSWGFYPKTVKNGVRDFSCGSNAVSRTDRKTKKEKIL